MEVIPSINCIKKECVQGRITLSSLFAAPWLHFDIADGIFTSPKTWNSPETLLDIFKSIHYYPNLEVHLMVKNFNEEVERWRPYAKRFIFQCETVPVESFHSISLENKEIEVGVSCMVETPVETIIPYITYSHFVQFLGVPPGPSGSIFNPIVIEKISWLRANFHDVTIEVDGGITSDIARRVKEAGANIVVSSSYIFDSEDPHKSYNELH